LPPECLREGTYDIGDREVVVKESPNNDASSTSIILGIAGLTWLCIMICCLAYCCHLCRITADAKDPKEDPDAAWWRRVHANNVRKIKGYRKKQRADRSKRIGKIQRTSMMGETAWDAGDIEGTSTRDPTGTDGLEMTDMDEEIEWEQHDPYPQAPSEFEDGGAFEARPPSKADLRDDEQYAIDVEMRSKRKSADESLQSGAL
jgi:hypothetical protein